MENFLIKEVFCRAWKLKTWNLVIKNSNFKERSLLLLQMSLKFRKLFELLASTENIVLFKKSD